MGRPVWELQRDKYSPVAAPVFVYPIPGVPLPTRLPIRVPTMPMFLSGSRSLPSLSCDVRTMDFVDRRLRHFILVHPKQARQTAWLVTKGLWL